MSEILTSENNVSLRYKKIIADQIYTKNSDGLLEKVFPGETETGSEVELPIYAKPTKLLFDTSYVGYNDTNDINKQNNVFTRDYTETKEKYVVRNNYYGIVSEHENYNNPDESVINRSTMNADGVLVEDTGEKYVQLAPDFLEFGDELGTAVLTKGAVDKLNNINIPAYVGAYDINFPGDYPTVYGYNSLELGDDTTNFNTKVIAGNITIIGVGGYIYKTTVSSSTISLTEAARRVDGTKPIISLTRSNCILDNGATGALRKYVNSNSTGISIGSGATSLTLDLPLLQKINKYLKTNNIEVVLGGDTSTLNANSLVINDKTLTPTLIQKLIDISPGIDSLPIYLKTSDIQFDNDVGSENRKVSITGNGFYTIFRPTPIGASYKSNFMGNSYIELIDKSHTSIQSKLKMNVDTVSLQSNRDGTAVSSDLKYNGLELAKGTSVVALDVDNGLVFKSGLGVVKSRLSDEVLSLQGAELNFAGILKVNELPKRRYYISESAGANRLTFTGTLKKPLAGTPISTILPGKNTFLLRNYRLGSLETIKGRGDFLPGGSEKRDFYGQTLYFWFFIDSPFVSSKYIIESSFTLAQAVITTAEVETSGPPNSIITTNHFYPDVRYISSTKHLACVGVRNCGSSSVNIYNSLLTIEILPESILGTQPNLINSTLDF